MPETITASFEITGWDETRVDGALGGRRGTFVIQHGGVGDDTDRHAFGHIVPGSGTGDCEGCAARRRSRTTPTAPA